MLRRPHPRRMSSSTGPASRTTSSSGPTARACTPGQRRRRLRHRRSRTSSAPRSTCRTRRGRSSSPRRSATRCRSTPTCPYVAEPGSKNKLSKRKIDAVPEEPPTSRRCTSTALAIAAAHRPADRGRDVQPGDRRFLRAGRLPARRDRQLPGAARLVARRQDRDLHARSEMIEQFSLERVNKAPASFDPKKLVAFQAALHAAAAARREGASGAALPGAAGWRATPVDDDARACRAHRRGAGRSASRSSATSSCRRVLLRRRGHIRREGLRQAPPEAGRRRSNTRNSRPRLT